MAHANDLNDKEIEYILLADKQGYVLSKSFMNIKKKGTKLGGYGRQIVTKGCLLQKINHTFRNDTPRNINVVVSCNDKLILQCDQNDIRQLTLLEREMLLAVPSDKDRYDVVNNLNQLTKGCQAKVGDDVSIDNGYDDVKGVLKYIGPISRSTGTVFGVMLDVSVCSIRIVYT